MSRDRKNGSGRHSRCLESSTVLFRKWGSVQRFRPSWKTPASPPYYQKEENGYNHTDRTPGGVQVVWPPARMKRFGNSYGQKGSTFSRFCRWSLFPYLFYTRYWRSHLKDPWVICVVSRLFPITMPQYYGPVGNGFDTSFPSVSRLLIPLITYISSYTWIQSFFLP